VTGDDASGIDPSLRVDDFAFDLPSHLIAQEPLPERDRARMIVVERATGRLTHAAVRDLPEWLVPGDLIVANNSRVLPARLRGTKEGTGGRVELLLLRKVEPARWSALARPSRRLARGQVVSIPALAAGDLPPLRLVVEEVATDGGVTIGVPDDFDEALIAYGEMPLPPYITTPLRDDDRYQTIYAAEPGSAAAPTAGLHVTADLQRRLRERGVGWAEVTLHVGVDTFRPVTVERVADHRIHREWCAVTSATAAAIAVTKQAGGRVVALGTTAARTLETWGAAVGAEPRALVAEASLFITPGYRWRVVDGMLTNLHVPRSTLLMMVSALAGPEVIRRAYQEAVRDEYRFFSFGDAMLIL
jgi:S-adenosylmethionine:tRNA ribosyltransferase-isomerase